MTGFLLSVLPVLLKIKLTACTGIRQAVIILSNRFLDALVEVIIKINHINNSVIQ